jgi:hypothetical protein
LTTDSVNSETLYVFFFSKYSKSSFRRTMANSLCVVRLYNILLAKSTLYDKWAKLLVGKRPHLNRLNELKQNCYICIHIKQLWFTNFTTQIVKQDSNL